MYFITSNEGKFREVERIAEMYGIQVKWMKMKYVEPQGNSLEEIAKLSARMLAEKIEGEFVIEDSGLFVEALKGFPGPYSSYVFKTIGNEGILKLMDGVKDRKAYFMAVVAYWDGEKAHVFTGKVDGEIADSARGTKGFGYDPIFLYGDKTFAEMETGEKNKVSHRRRAFEEFFKWLKEKS
ncbi:XTP/dITP diphosphatase [Archaeoglobus neptunius]|uniref:XTP/dITP diphosphatase n=1 Tax=Archaeoglobus neptunius TaxID=2798580 RepID=UPI001925535F|nr:XTP/dITP diphosphatase [Archaeoglobus neptunius]